MSTTKAKYHATMMAAQESTWLLQLFEDLLQLAEFPIPDILIRVPYPFQWGAPTFDAGEAFAMMAASFVALVEAEIWIASATILNLNAIWSTGTFLAVARYASATPMPPSILSRGIGWQGIGILFSGIFGTGNGSSVSVENGGLLAMTRVGSRRVVQISAGFMIFFSILGQFQMPISLCLSLICLTHLIIFVYMHCKSGKFGAVFASIPAPIIAALYCLFFGYVGKFGWNQAIYHYCSIQDFHNSTICANCMVQYFNEYTAINGFGPVHTGARWFNDMINVPFSSEAFVAGSLAMFLDVTLHGKDNATKRERGMHLWEKFKSFKKDARSEEFYALPFNLNKFFPSDEQIGLFEMRSQSFSDRLLTGYKWERQKGEDHCSPTILGTAHLAKEYKTTMYPVVSIPDFSSQSALCG
ncbi:hypothetical protein Gotur_029880 [Gossypium turneri]